VASSDPVVRGDLFRLAADCGIPALPIPSAREVLAVLACNPVTLVVCATQLEDGTFGDLLRDIRRAGLRVPVVVAAGPDLQTEFQQFLEALHLGAYGFLCFPYRRLEFERVLDDARREYP
jgi:DNA-binding NtrC family response regulator